MSTTRAHLALYFDAPLQSWGYASRFDRRTTLPYPTRSGVLGLLCAARGVDRHDTAGLARLAGLRLTVVALRQRGRLVDYHTVGGGYDEKRERQHICRKASGGVGSTVQTRREYLEDARHGAIVCGTSVLVSEFASALANPRWGVWLGRKACIPASPVFQGVFDDEAAALAKLRQVSGAAAIERIVREVTLFADGDDTIMDVPLDFSPNTRRFAPRRVKQDVTPIEET
jgi:CRISPR system Cascade subunit CasD